MPVPRWKSLLSSKFQVDLLWNFISLGFIGAGGILLNILIALFYEPADLGIFNQTYAIFMLTAQLAVLGIPNSVLKYAAEHSSQKEIWSAIITSAAIIAVICAFATAAGLWLFRNLIGSLLSSAKLPLSLAWVTPGVFFLAINKIFLSAFNGLSRMRLYAAIQSLRFFLMIVVFFVLALIGWRGDCLAALFSFSELIVLIVSIFSIGHRVFLTSFKSMKQWFPVHFKFGFKSSGSGVLLVLNTRVDVLMLGYFCSDAIVGIYSFSAILAEGFYQMAMVVTRNVTPILVQRIANKEYEELKAFIKKGKRVSFIFMAITGTILILTYPFWVRLITARAEYHTGWLVFSILVGGIMAASGYLPFRNILLAAGLPGWHSILTIILVGTNILLNAILIPIFKMTGAAIATAVAMASLVIWLKVCLRRPGGFFEKPPPGPLKNFW